MKTFAISLFLAIISSGCATFHTTVDVRTDDGRVVRSEATGILPFWQTEIPMPDVEKAGVKKTAVQAVRSSDSSDEVDELVEMDLMRDELQRKAADLGVAPTSGQPTKKPTRPRPDIHPLVRRDAEQANN